MYRNWRADLERWLTLVSQKSKLAEAIRYPLARWGQNKNCSELYAKAERNMNITPPVGFVPASEAF